MQNDWPGIYSLEPSPNLRKGALRLETSHSADGAINQVSITIENDTGRYDAAKDYLSRHNIRFMARKNDMTWAHPKGVITIEREMPVAMGGDSIQRLYNLIVSEMSGEVTKTHEPGKIKPEYIAAALHGQLFGPLLTPPIAGTPETNGHARISPAVKPLLERERSQAQVATVVDAWKECSGQFEAQQARQLQPKGAVYRS